MLKYVKFSEKAVNFTKHHSRSSLRKQFPRGDLGEHKQEPCASSCTSEIRNGDMGTFLNTGRSFLPTIVNG